MKISFGNPKVYNSLLFFCFNSEHEISFVFKIYIETHWTNETMSS